MEFTEIGMKKAELEEIIEKYKLQQKVLTEESAVIKDEKSYTLFIPEAKGDPREDPIHYYALIWQGKKVDVEYLSGTRNNPPIKGTMITKIIAPIEFEAVRDELFNIVIDAVRASILRPADSIVTSVPVFGYIAEPIFR